jgi:putative peptide zinc metalloprotease protein
VWWFSGYDALLLVVATQILQMLQQLTPLVRFDGYHVLADVTGVPDLFHRIKPTLLGVLPWRWGDPEARLLKPWARAVVTLWVVVVVPLLLLALLAMVLTLPRILGTAWARIQQEQDLIAAAWSDGDLVQLAARVLTVLAVVLPVAAVLYMLFRLGRQVSVATWRATAGRPVRRTVAAVTALALAAALAWVWWPRPDTYKPIQPDERGTITDLVRPAAVLGRPGFAAPATASAAAPVAAAATAPTIARGDRGTVQAVWDTDQNVPTEAEPVPAVVLIPRPDAETTPSTDATPAPSPTPTDEGTTAGGTTDGGTTTAPTAAPTPSAAPGTDPAAPSAWVFPFDRPLAPEPGDNQALAENTTDGTAQYDVALAMVWVEGGEDALNTNEAYAFASCNTCASVAIAFQVVMVIGDNDVAVPQNLSGAVNYNCVNCLTYALAQQLFITLDGPLSEGARAQLDEIWTQIAAFGQSITGIPLDQIDDRLDEFEQQILDVIETDQPGTVPRSSPGADPSGTATAGTTGPSPTAGGTTGPSPSAGTTTGPSPTSAPTGPGTGTTGPTSSPTAGQPSPTAGPTNGPTSTPTTGPTSTPTTGSSTGPTTGPTSSGATAGATTTAPGPTGTGTGTASTDTATGSESSSPTP